MKRVRNLILMIFMLWSALASAQTLQSGRDLFSKGNYEAAKPIMLKYLKQQPENASRNYWYGVCLYETGEKDKCLPYLEKAAAKKIIKAYRYIGNYYNDKGEFSSAADNYELFVAGMKADKELHNPALEERFTFVADSVRKQGRMVRNTEMVCFIDSFVADKDDFLSKYILDRSAGTITTFSEVFDSEEEGDAFTPETGGTVFFSRVGEDSLFHIYQGYKSLDMWMDPVQITAADNGGDSRWPFVESDGVTMYYASNGNGSIGGYDIFATRYNSATDRWLVPENIGMPFNSDANDYMYVIDDVNNLGWFATDRRQPEGKVCIYVFIPNESRVVYPFSEENASAVIRASKIISIAESQTDADAVRTARQRLMMLTFNQENQSQQGSFLFVVDDMNDYHELSDFKSEEARKMFQRWQELTEQHAADSSRLENMRDNYALSSKQAREGMRKSIQELEDKVLKQEEELDGMEMRIRNTEITYLSH